MSAKDLERHNERILHQVGVNCSVEDVDGSVITGGCEEGEGGVESNTSQSTSVVSSMSFVGKHNLNSLPERLVWLERQVQVEPTQFLIVTTHKDVIARRVDIQTTDPLDTRLQGLDQCLTGKIVQSDVALRRGEEPWFKRVERDTLDRSTSLLERRLSSMS